MVATAGRKESQVGRRRRLRAVAAATAVLGALTLWALVEVALGMDLQSPASGSRPSEDIGAAHVVVSSGSASLVAWAALAAAERFAARPRRLWATGAVLALLVSLGAPLSGSGITGANRAVLVLLHLAVGALLIPALYRTSPEESRAKGEER